MHRSKGKGRAFARTTIMMSAVASALAAGHAFGKTVPFTSGQFMLPNGKTAEAGTVSQDNITIRSLTVGSRTIRADAKHMRAPVMVRAVDLDGSVIDLGTELAAGMIRVPGMTALDAMSGMDLGRMAQVAGDRPTRVQVFLTMKEQDNDAFADDSSPEIVVFGANAPGSLRVRAILDGTPDVPESMVMGSFRELPGSLFAQGTLPVRMRYAGSAEPQMIGAVGLDLSGDLGVGPGKSVVGYEIEVPAGAALPLKVLSAGEVEFGAYANYSEFSTMLAATTLGQSSPAGGADAGSAILSDLDSTETRIIGPALLGEVERRPLNYDNPPPEAEPFQKGDLLPFSESGSNPLPQTPTTATPIPAPAASLVLAAAGALGLGARRRRA